MTTVQLDACAQATALYRFFDTADQLLYVGITSALPMRIKVHDKTQPWYHEVASIKVEHFETRALALAAEVTAIRIERPKYNIVHNEAVTGRTPQRKFATGESPVRSFTGEPAGPEAILALSEVVRLTGLPEAEVRRLGSYGYLRTWPGFGKAINRRESSYVESTVEELIEVMEIPEGPEREETLQDLRRRNRVEDRRRKDIANQFLFEAGIIKSPTDPVR